MKSLKSKLTLSTSLSLLTVLILYTAFSFGAWQFNPELWSEMGRVMFAMLSIFIIVIPVIFIVTEHK